ncbi:TetR family transcriptional regulator [Actinomadura pelletieri DSM 43383]|uniref:TetR family transcriptional regulator n=1 Tax=Actinomadura pelletieri DSM 43383 TaxID=1120940 RepID=A0A495Q9M1_9ACTN|nr:TetR/AcrR family transcriptional regulator C-terminal domain-containing protein [Actinomadura pelletieri]RKS67786.1 TetR family transcriptional regulator [Actinomadura pelletieri DSM 43383]
MTESVWLRKGRPRREAPPLTRERIVEEAVALLDEEGTARLTMRRLAERLDTGSTTLYWHVKTKDDVLELALDAVFGDVPLRDPGPDWRADVVALMSGWRRAMLDHPWSAAVLGGRPLLGPNVLARTDALYAALAATGVTGPRLAAAAYAVANYVIGSALMQIGARNDDDPAAEEAAREHLARDRARYPTLAAHGHLPGDQWDSAFAQGLDHILDGLSRGP